MSDVDEMLERNKENHEALSSPDPVTDKAIDVLLEEIKDFQESKHVTRKRLLKVAWTVAGGLGGVAIAQAVALAVLMPLKQTEPIMLEVHKEGHVNVIRDFNQVVDFPNHVDEYMLREYVTQRETYDWNKLQYLVDYTNAWSAPHVYEEYYKYTTMPNSNMEVLKDEARIDAVITSADVRKELGMATFRITKTPKTAAGKKLDSFIPTHWVVELKYTMDYKQPERNRKYNPFGYKVTSYTLVQENTGGN